MSSYKETELTVFDLPSTRVEGAPLVLDDFALALRLGVKCRTLWYCIRSKKQLYSTFHTPKSNGKKRTIHNPNPVLKYVQRMVARHVILKHPILPCVGAYVEGKSCRDSAKRHVGHAVLVKLDLQNFFPTHTRGRVRWFFHNHFGYSQFVSGLLGDLLTAPFPDKHRVPQGSPASPSLCNLIAQETLDRKILDHIDGTGWVYTRYSDDLTLSHPDDQPRRTVNRLVKDLRRIITKAEYRTNTKKTKIQRRWRRQKMLGMVINEKTSIPRETYRRYRAILHNCLKHGFEPNEAIYGWTGTGSFREHLLGKVSYFVSVDPLRGGKLKEAYDKADTANKRKGHLWTAANNPYLES